METTKAIIFSRIYETLIKDPNFKVSEIKKTSTGFPCFTVKPSGQRIDMKAEMEKAKILLLMDRSRFITAGKDTVIGKEQRHHTVIFNEEKDSIHVRENVFGFKFSRKKMRIYPIVKNVNKYTWTKHLYYFAYSEKGKFNLPRIYIGGTEVHWILKPMLNISFMPEFDMKASYRHIIGAKNEGDVFERKNKIKLPKAIKKVLKKTEDIQFFVDTIEKDSWNTACQVISKRNLDKEYEGEPKIKLVEELVYHHLDENNKDKGNILIYSHCVPIIRDHLRMLKNRHEKFSFKIKSFRRIEEEHDRISQEEILKGIPEVRVHKKYVEVTEKIISEAESKGVYIELISTKERLAKESDEMKHCVATYASRINMGDCCIWRVCFNELKLTAEIKLVDEIDHKRVQPQDYSTHQYRTGVQSFELNQLKGKYNNRQFTEFEMVNLREAEKRIKSMLINIKTTSNETAPSNQASAF